MPALAATTTIITTTTTMDDEPHILREGDSSLSLTSEEGQSESQPNACGEVGKLLIWLSPAFPVGSFAFSHGLEWAVHAGRVHDAATAIAWLGALLEHGGPRNDAIFAANAWRATKDRKAHALREVNELALAAAGSKERHLETTAQGNAFVAIVRQAWSAPSFDWAIENLGSDIAYPVAVGTASASHGIPLDATLNSFALAQVQNLVSAIIRLSVIGHTDGQRVIAALLPNIAELALSAKTATLDDVGGAAFQSDIAALSHEILYSRLFRS